MPISVQLVDDTARGSDDTPVPDAFEQHAVIDAPVQPLLDIPPFPPFFAGEMSPLSQNDHAPLLAQQAHHFMEHGAGSAGVSHKRQTPEGARDRRSHKHKDRRRCEDKGT
eukprot:490174-Prymnesium_polylepis.1